MTALTPSQIDYLSRQRLGRLATVDRSGAPQNNPVGYGYNRATGTIDIGGHNMASSRKYRNLRANARVAFVVDDIVSFRPWQVRCLEIRGYAEALDAAGDSAAPTGGPIIRVHPERVIAFGIDKPAPDSDETEARS